MPTKIEPLCMGTDQRRAGWRDHSRRGQGRVGASSSREDAHKIDALARQSPERAYDIDFFEDFAKEAGWRIGT